MKRTILTLTCVLTLVAAACGASGQESGEDEENPETTEAEQVADEITFGDMPSPCGDGDATVAPGEGPATDKLVIGVANDRGADAIGRAGLNKEVWDASQAFAQWCNDQGGIQGLQIELVELDAQAVNVEAAMIKACTDVFAMVGGGMAQDQLQFSGNAESDFHQCGLIDIPAFAVSIEKAGSNGKIEPIPNPSDKVATQWVQDFVELYPEESQNFVIAYGELPSLQTVKAQFEAAAEAEGLELLPPISYPLLGVDDWGQYADLIIQSGAEAMYWIGEPDNAASMTAKLREKGWDGPILHQGNVYDESIFGQGAKAAENNIVRIPFPPFEEANRWPAIQQYLDLVGEIPDGKVAALGIQSMSAWLLFATAVNACAEGNDGVIDRTCILEEAAAVEDWTAGGLHVPTDPGSGVGPECGMLIITNNGEFERLWPELGGEGDDYEGYSCPEDSIVDVDISGLGEGKVDPDREI